MGDRSEAVALLDRLVSFDDPVQECDGVRGGRCGMTHAGQTDAYYNTTCELYVAVHGSH